jgi:hypothetical protein
MNEGCKSTPLFLALLVCTKAPVEYQANLVSYFDHALPCFLGNEVFIDASGYIGSTSSKPHTLAGFPCEEKCKCAMLILLWRLVYNS